MFGASRAELSAQLHRELRALYTHFESGLSLSEAPKSKNSVGLQSPLCWPRAPAHPGNIAHSRLDGSAIGHRDRGHKGSLWAGWAGAWPGGRWGGSTLSGMAVMPVSRFKSDVNTKSLAPKLRILRPAPTGDVIAVMLKGEWPKLNMDVSTLEKDLDDIIMEPDPCVATSAVLVTLQSNSSRTGMTSLLVSL